MRKSIYGILAIAVLFSSCSSVKILSDVDKDVDFTKFTTYEYYGWAEESDKILNDLDKARIEGAFGEEFTKRGLNYVEKGSGGDLIVTLYIVTEQKTQRSATTTGMGGGGYYGYGYGYGGYGPGYGWGGGTVAHTTYNEYDYTVGTIVVAVYDEKDKKLIWESFAQGTINENTKGRDERVKKVAARMMKEYPVQPPK